MPQLHTVERLQAICVRKLAYAVGMRARRERIRNATEDERLYADAAAQRARPEGDARAGVASAAAADFPDREKSGFPGVGKELKELSPLSAYNAPQ